MPINYQEVYSQIRTIGAGAKERRKKKEEAQVQATDLLAYFDSKLDLRTYFGKEPLPLAISAILEKAPGSVTAKSASTFRSSST